MSLTYRYDTKGVRFEFPACILSKWEYAKIISEINTNYSLYKDMPFAIHYSVGVDNCYYLYYCLCYLFR